MIKKKIDMQPRGGILLKQNKWKLELIGIAIVGSLFLTGCNENANKDMEATDLDAPNYQNVTVHDPSVIKDDDTFYVFGSHLMSAKSDDLIEWDQVSNGVHEGNVLIPNAAEEMEEALTWAETDTFWAADVIQLEDGKYYMYYNACRGDSPLSAMGIATSDSIEGPYEDQGIILKSGMTEELSEDGDTYDGTQDPNVVDPDVFYDKDGKLWMVYGSYSGGIFILELDAATGEPLPDQGYGKKLLGGNHSRIEAPFMQYNADTGYYYLFLSYGGLDAVGGYNMRVARSENPDGPFVDAEGKDMIEAKGAAGSFFDDEAVAPYGAKIMGNFTFSEGDGYVSPGHNSTYYEEETDEYFIYFHTRFPDRGEEHELRVHQMFFNEDGWPVVAPHRYGGEEIETYSEDKVTGSYEYINHGKDISEFAKLSEAIELEANGEISGSVTGEWELEGNQITIVIDGTSYDGVFLSQWNPFSSEQVMTFSAMSDNGVTIWGSQAIE